MRLIIELDGEGRVDSSVQTCDAKRTLYLQVSGYIVTRIENEELLLNPKIVFSRIARLIESPEKLPHP